MGTGTKVGLCVLAAWTLAACAGNPRTPSPASPSSLPVTADTFVGAWSSVSSGTALPLAACTRFDYTVEKVGERAVNLTVAAACASVTIDASGSGTLTASALSWAAQGKATGASGTECAFSFTDSSATPLNDGTIRVDYKGKVCGVPVSGSEVVRKR
jgi:hypothetical protein